MSNEKRPLPTWATDYLRLWQSILHLDAWIIDASLKDMDGEAGARVTIRPDIYKAAIQFDEGSFPETLAGDEDGEGRKTIIHELIHVFIARIPDFVECDIFHQLSQQTKAVARETMIREVEPVVELLTRVLFALKEEKNGN